MSSTVTVTHNGDVTYFKINNTTTLMYLWKVYCQRMGVQILFSYENNLIPKEYYKHPIVNLGMTSLDVYFPEKLNLSLEQIFEGRR